MSSEPIHKHSPEVKPKHHPKTKARNETARTHTKPTALQRHVEFFDRDCDGIISPLDTFIGFRAIGFGIALSLLSVMFIHGGFSWLTWGWIPDPLFRININNIHQAKHGSDSESYTARGDFDEKRFSYVFDLYSAPPHTHLSFAEGVCMLHGQRNAFDLFGWVAAGFEWLATYIMLWPEDGRMSKEDVRRVYDGSIFYELSGWSKPKQE